MSDEKKRLLPMESDTSPALADLFIEADPVVASFMTRHNALLERVTVLERALELVREIVDDDWLSREARTGVAPRHEIRRATRALDA